MKKTTKQKKSKKLNVLAISHYNVLDNRGGGEIMFHEILKSLVNAGFNVDAVATWTEDTTKKLDGVTVYRGKEHLALLDKKYDLVITQFHEANNVIDVCKKRGIPVVFVAHNTYPNTAETLQKKPNLVVFNTQWVRDYHEYDDKYIIVHPPVYREQHATTPGDMITLINLIPSKGSNMFYNLAMRMLRYKFLAVEGGYYKDKQQILDIKNVVFQPNTNDMKNDVWARTKILLMPSTYESYGMVGVEAMASGIPVIALKTPGLEESLGSAGLFQEDDNLIRWMRLIDWLHIPENYEEASRKALTRSMEINPKVELDAFVKKAKELIK